MFSKQVQEGGGAGEGCDLSDRSALPARHIVPLTTTAWKQAHIN